MPGLESTGQPQRHGCATGVGSLIFVRLGVDHECDNEVCILSHDQMKVVSDPKRNSQLQLALLNNGVDPMSGGTRFVMGAAHSDQDVENTVASDEKALTDVRQMGLI